MPNEQQPFAHTGLEPQNHLQRLRGLIPPLALPLTSGGDLDFSSLNRQVDYLLSGPVNGLWVNGTTGDFFALTDEEGAAVLGAVIEQVKGRVPVVAQIGDTVTRKVIRKGHLALQAGADYLAAVLPYYLDYTQEELKEHYRTLSAELRRPLILYQLPQMCKVSLTVPTVIELAREGVLIGIKDSSGNQDYFRRLIETARAESVTLRCFVGGGNLMDVSLMAGADGLMCAIANLVPAHCHRLFSASQVGDWEQVRRLQSRIIQLTEAMRLPDRPNWAATVAIYKWVLRELGVIASDAVFAPLKPLTAAEKAHLQQRVLPLLQEMVSPQ
jgi:4-hydroxy-tetrahydrodipicolinate synthase